MTDTITTAVTNTITRIVVMEKLAVPDSTGESKRWIHWEQDVPYWTNRLGGMVQTRQHEWRLTVIGRLVLSHISQATAGGTSSPQDKVWSYVPDTMRYFNTYRQLNPPTYAEIQHIAPPGVTISAPGGMDIFNIPGQTFTVLYVDFSIDIPFLIYD